MPPATATDASIQKGMVDQESRGNQGVQRERPQTPPPVLVANPKSTPLSKKVSGSAPYSSAKVERDGRFETLAGESTGMFVGPMPPKDFLEKFLNVPSSGFPSPSFAFLGPPRNASKEEGQSQRSEIEGRPIKSEVEIATSIAKTAGECVGPAFKLALTGSKTDPETDHLFAADICMYKLLDEVLGYTSTDPMDRTNFARMEFFIEVKSDRNHDGFRDDGVFEADTVTGKSTRGQLASYAAAIMTTQFRVHLFSVLVCGRNARLIRWDRAGAIITNSFDYVDESDILAEFFWNYARLPQSGRGYDTSASAASKDQQVHGHSLPGPLNLPVFVLSVPPREEGAQSKEILVRRPQFIQQSPFGRATRGMRGIDLSNGKQLYLKDYWRPDAAGIEKEGVIYDVLHKKGVRNIASFYCGNDVAGQTTRTQDHSSGSVEKFQHYRMALGDVGRPLTSFRSSRELVNAIADAMEGHQDAFERANILHRDISVGNILIKDDGRGMLIDWDLSVNNSDPVSAARRMKRTGTWQFISISLLLNTSRRHELADDRESALWVLLWVLLRYSRHNLSASELSDLLLIFDESRWLDETVRGGKGKRDFLVSDIPSNTVQFVDRPVLNPLIRHLSETFAVRYQLEPSAEDIEAYNEVLPLIETHRSPGNRLLETLVVHRRKKAMSALSKSRWLVDALREATSKDGWPSEDRAVAQTIGGGGQGSGQKRKRDGAS
ncbi:hypothetical protein BS47DRAFT_1335924 [Hydnum rufescens UP504]|uniref:Protein kinase domain-containing protein n=1 Tax=Hydnum rufescens UP504 TaxID=1448309 RepID=A0A9P6BAA1_9AGAM|nr:hypothetical protein BS47DRAFT_1335924 [Hydnum rufescens UP504]